MTKLRIGYAFCGSFCTLARSLEQMKALAAEGHEIIPILSERVATLDTRFGRAEDFRRRVEEIAGRSAIRTIEDAEPLGPSLPLDLLILAPCTGNTLVKIAAGITDSSVTMAAKAA